MDPDGEYLTEFSLPNAERGVEHFPHSLNFSSAGEKTALAMVVGGDKKTVTTLIMV